MVQQYAAEDNGIPYLRRVNLDGLKQAMAHGTPAYPGTTLGTYPAGRDGRQQIREEVMRPIFQDIVNALTSPLKDFEREPYKYWNPGYPSGVGSPGEHPVYTFETQAGWKAGYYSYGDAVGINKSREDFDKAYRKFLGDDLFENDGIFEITGTSEADAYRKFNDFAIEHKFGDGLPLVPPTEDLVNAMLAATARDPDDVMGSGHYMRKGKPTVRTIAVNAVMAGAKPEYFPVILAALDGVCEEVENVNRFHHTMTSGASYSQVVAVSGPIVKELGMETDANFFGAGNSVNNVIGRAIRLAMRNTAHQWQPHIDTARSGRHNDHTFFVVAENLDALPTGWVSFAEDAGFPAGSSVVGLFGSGRYMDQYKDAGATNQAWTAAGLRTALKGQSDASTQGVVILTPAMAKAVQSELSLTKATARGNGTNAISGGATKYVLVAGTDPGRAMSFGANTHGSGNSMRIQRICTATKAQAGTAADFTAPSTPVNFTVTKGANPGEAILTWQPPTHIGKPITEYQVTATERDYGNWIRVPGGDTARSYTLTGLDGGYEYQFRVRAVAGHTGAYAATAVAAQQGWGGARAPLTGSATGASSPVNIASMGAPATVLSMPACGSPASIRLKLSSIGGATAPQQVQGMHLKYPATGGVSVNWRKPVSDGGSAITKYQYRVRTTTTADGTTFNPWADNWIDVNFADCNEKTRIYSVTITESVAAVWFRYFEIEVRAVNVIGAGPEGYVTPTTGAANAFILRADHTNFQSPINP
jgi:hypothetical protein